MTDGDQGEFPAFARAVLRLTGTDLEQYRREQTERRVRALARRRGADGLYEYLVLLRRSEAERELLRDHVTINVSRLWRNPEHWELLEEAVLAPLAATGRGLRAWSAGCSYGAEPYTLAMLWQEIGPSSGPLRIDATDIDEGSIARARTGRFTEDDVRDMPPATRDRWLKREGHAWVAARELRRFVHFQVADIFEPATTRYDLVMCRNVVIYHTPERRDQIHRLLAGSLRTGGWLMVGATERVTRPEAIGLRPEHPFLYRRFDHEIPRP